MKYEVEPRSVRRVMKEFDQIGENAFFSKYGGGRSRRYQVQHPDEPAKRYPSAAIAQAAMGWEDVRGGYDHPYSACPLLERAGFTIYDANSADIRDQLEDDLSALSETERTSIVKQRIGQNLLRSKLVKLRGSECEVTGLTDIWLLRASHIKPWSACETSRERLDVDNVLLLSALWDAAFDKGLVSFDEEGEPIFSSQLTPKSKKALTKGMRSSLWPSEKQVAYLHWHQKHVFRP